MIAKVIVHGPSRAVALGRMSAALANTEAAGTVTNLGFLAALTQDSDFAAGQVDTGLIARKIDALTKVAAPSGAVLAEAALVALGLDGAPGPLSGFTLWAPNWQQVQLTHDDQSVDLQVCVLGGGQIRIRTGDSEIHAVWRDGWRLDGAKACGAIRHGDEITVFSGAGVTFGIPDPLARSGTQGIADGVIVAPMPGFVRALFAKVGAPVREGQQIVVLEAMKMEQALLAPRDGVIAEVLVAEGAQVEAGAALIRLEDET